MLSVVCVEPKLIALKNKVEPVLVKGMVKVRVRRIGICGTDFHIYEGSHPFLQYPRVMGHELSGEVAEINEDAKLLIGDRVIVNPYLACGKCVACRNEKPNCCTNISVLGVHTDGGMCEYINVPEAQLYLANDLTFTQAAMVEFLSIGAHAVRRGEIKSGDHVLVVGAGPIGLGAALFASIAGAQVAILDVSVERVEAATALVSGATGFVINEALDAQIAEYTQHDMFNVVMDATGNKRAMEKSIEFVAHGGSCVFISVVKSTISFSDPIFHSHEMRLIGSRNATKMDFEHVIACIKNKKIPIDKLNTHTAALADLPEKIPQWLSNPVGLIKAMAIID